VRCALPADWAAFPGGEVDGLQRALSRLVSQLDYRLLNELLEQPDDLQLAQWLRARLPVPGLVQLGLSSTACQGVRLDPSGTPQVWRRYRCQCAHWLPGVPAGHPCGRLHGHGFEVVVQARSDRDADSPGAALARLDAAWAPLHAQLDHVCLNDLPGLDNPTSERLASWLWDRVSRDLPGLSGLTVHETASSGAHFDGQHHRIWKAFSLDSAVQLQRAPDGHALGRVHGHSYQLRLHLLAPLDEVLGWTVDYGDVKRRFDPIFRALDHQPLHEKPELADADTASVAQWILAQAQPLLPALDRVDLDETAGCGAIVQRGAALPTLAI
jgi:6-pyruvoyltetrahydropterin/6-carboxytetrahydropterin synthase